jgi:hypothetical protein
VQTTTSTATTAMMRIPSLPTSIIACITRLLTLATIYLLRPDLNLLHQTQQGNMSTGTATQMPTFMEPTLLPRTPMAAAAAPRCE